MTTHITRSGNVQHLRLQSLPDAKAAGAEDARQLLDNLSELFADPDGSCSAGLLVHALTETISRATEYRAEECSARLEGFAEAIGPILHLYRSEALETNTSSLSDINPLIDGAKERIAALVKLEQSANNLPKTADDSAVFLSIQSSAAETFVSQFGPLTPRQEGAFRTLAEYIHFGTTTGWPDLERWTPFVADTPEEIAAWIAEANRDG